MTFHVQNLHTSYIYSVLNFDSTTAVLAIGKTSYVARCAIIANTRSAILTGIRTNSVLKWRVFACYFSTGTILVPSRVVYD